MNARFRTDRRVCPEPSLCWGAAKSALKRSFFKDPLVTDRHRPPPTADNHDQRSPAAVFSLPRTLLLTHALFETSETRERKTKRPKLPKLASLCSSLKQLEKLKTLKKAMGENTVRCETGRTPTDGVRGTRPFEEPPVSEGDRTRKTLPLEAHGLF